MNRLEELQERIERQRNRLDAMIEKEIEEETFFSANVELDRLIAEYIELSETEDVLNSYEQ